MPATGRETLTNQKTLRIAAGFSISDLARLSRTSDLTIKVIENGGTAMSAEVARIITALGTDQAGAGHKIL